MNIGERVGDYEVVGVLGIGGMGEVYKVRNVISDRMEAMKVLLPSMSGDPELASRFLREIKTQATLDHPNIARLHTAFQSGDQLFMIMEFVDGSSIEKLMTQDTLLLSDAMSYTSQVLEALAYAHARDVIHRDIKPANIMVTPAGVAKLMDFGIARMKADIHLTKTGHAVGSLYYMSPEQIKGSEPDPRSDVYSLGITFYEMVTGRKPFQGDSDYSIMAAHLQQLPAAPIEVVPGVPPEVSDIILMAIAKEPSARFQSADAFRAALKNAGATAAPGARITRILGVPPPMPAPAPAAVTAIMPPPLAYEPPPPVSMAPPLPPPPPPPAYAMAPNLPPPPPPAYSIAPVQPKSSSRRGLYMTLGSVATLVVLAAGIIEIPKLRRTSAQENLPLPVVAAPQQSQAPENRQPDPVPLPSAVAEPSPVPAAAPSPVVQVTPVSPRPTPAPGNPRPAPVPVPIVQAPQARPDNNPRPVPPPPQAQPAPAPQAAPQAPSASAAQLNQLRQEYNQLSIRASTAKDGLQGLQQQMQRQGLNLRADMREAQTRMDYQLKEAQDSIRAGNAEQAGKDLEMARLALESIEKFLGR